MSVKKASLFFLLLILLGNCSFLDEEKLTVRFPITEEAVSGVMAYFQSLDPRNGVNATFVPFDLDLDSHPRIVGFIEVSAKAEVDGVGHTVESLSAYINTIKSLNIVPSKNTYWDRGGNEFLWLAEQVEENEKHGVKHQYIILEDNELRLIW